MNQSFTKAGFWKCALQVNPYSYLSYRGQTQPLAEEDYNRQLLEVCKEEDIKILGLADHGNVDGIDAIRKVMTPNGIIVFPGFEIATTEKVHFVCLFPEETTKDQLNRYLGKLGLTDPENGVWPSDLGGNDLLSKIDELDGFCYAAHSTDASGILKQKLVHVWKNEKLKAAQIPGTLDDLKTEESNGYRLILKNKTPDYKREMPVAILNAKDVENPETLKNPKASCLIKMTRPGFDAFKLAFQDPDSRVRLNTDVADTYYSRIETLSVTGGYLDGVHIEFSEHLNSVIGGRGTGKSTLLECIRYALQLEPIGKNAKKQHLEIIRENIGKSKARIELTIRSSKMNGKRYRVARRYGEMASIKDDAGNNSSFTPLDLLPEIEIYGQNEIYEIAQDGNSQLKLLSRFLDIDGGDAKIQEIVSKLSLNRDKLIQALNGIASIEDELSQLPKLEEQVKQFKALGLEDKLGTLPLLETEKRLAVRVQEEELSSLKQAVESIKDALPDTVFLSDKALEKLPHADLFKQVKMKLDDLKTSTEKLVSQWQAGFSTTQTQIDGLIKTLSGEITKEEIKLETLFKGLPSSEGKSGREIGFEYQQLLQRIEKIKPRQTTAETQRSLVKALKAKRDDLLGELSALRSTRSAQFERSLRRLNRKLDKKLKLTVKPEADRQPLIDYLLGCNLENVGAARLNWINEADDFSPVKLAVLIEKGADALQGAGWRITPTVAGALEKMDTSKILEMQELELPDIIDIELNVSHRGEPQYRPLNRLSTGQQCTAILHLLLLQNKDPLIMDQPEDNLDNAFIADRIVTELRQAKLNRQFVFATHNANIPVFGDAEWIGVFESVQGQAVLPESAQGAIDVENVKEMAANILEGGQTAFNQRKLKYGY
jgi:predicted ATPase